MYADVSRTQELRLGMVTTSYPKDEDDLAGRFVAEMAESFAAQGRNVCVITPGQQGPSGFLSLAKLGQTFRARLARRLGRGRAKKAGHRLARSSRTSRVAATDETAESVAVRAVLYPWPWFLPSIFGGNGAPDALERRSWLWAEAAPYLWALVRTVSRESVSWSGAVAHWLVPSGLVCARVARALPLVAVGHSADINLLCRLPGTSLWMDTLLRPGVRVTFSCEAQRARLLERLSPRVAEKLLSRSVVRPMGIRVRQIASGDREGTRKLLGISGFTVLFLGRLVPVKRPLLLRELAVRMPHATFMVAGDGPLREILETRIEQAGLWDRFRMLGTVGEKVKADLFAACDAVVLPSGEVKGGRTEGAPVAVLEALAAGRPVVASDVGGVGEWVRHRETGMLCPAEDIDSMVEGLEELRIDESLRFELSRNARSVGARQDWSEVIATYDRLLEEAVRDYA